MLAVLAAEDIRHTLLVVVAGMLHQLAPARPAPSWDPNQSRTLAPHILSSSSSHRRAIRLREVVMWLRPRSHPGQDSVEHTDPEKYNPGRDSCHQALPCLLR